MQLEQEQLPGPKRVEVGGGRRPEIDLGKTRLPSQHLEPIVVGDGNYEIDAHARQTRKVIKLQAVSGFTSSHVRN